MTRNTQPAGGNRSNHPLTERRQQILDFIRDSTERRGYPPSLREIGDAVGLKSTSAVSFQVKILEEMGYLTRDARMPRTVVEKSAGLRVVQQWWNEAGETPVDFGSPNVVGVPMFERMGAGHLVTANPESVGIMWLPREVVGSGDFFAVRVVGDSMINVNIFDGDYVIVRQQQVADNGDTIAALIDEEATVKTFQRADGHVWLMPQNPRYERIPGDHCHVMGKVVLTMHPK